MYTADNSIALYNMLSVEQIESLQLYIHGVRGGDDRGGGRRGDGRQHTETERSVQRGLHYIQGQSIP